MQFVCIISMKPSKQNHTDRPIFLMLCPLPCAHTEQLGFMFTQKKTSELGL